MSRVFFQYTKKQLAVFMIMMCIYLNAMMHLPIGSVGLALFTYMLAHRPMDPHRLEPDRVFCFQTWIMFNV